MTSLTSNSRQVLTCWHTSSVFVHRGNANAVLKIDSHCVGFQVAEHCWFLRCQVSNQIGRPGLCPRAFLQCKLNCLLCNYNRPCPPSPFVDTNSVSDNNQTASSTLRQHRLLQTMSELIAVQKTFFAGSSAVSSPFFKDACKIHAHLASLLQCSYVERHVVPAV